MQIEQERNSDSLWQQFIDALSDEFIRQTGVGIYAYITPADIDCAYEEYQQNQGPIHNFTHNYVRSFV